MCEECLDCVEATARLHLYLDRELTNDEVEIVQHHLTDCNDCESRFHFDQRVKRLVHECCTIEQAPGHLRDAVLRLARNPAGQALSLDPELFREVKRELKADLRNDNTCK